MNLFTFIGLYVDNIMITGKCKEVNDITDKIKKIFQNI